MWTTRKLVFTGLFGALIWVLYLAISLPIISVAGTGMGSVIMPFISILLIIIFKRIINEFGSATIFGLILSALFLPLPFFGPPGFLPKIVIILVGTAVLDVVYRMLVKKPMYAAVISSVIASIVLAGLMFTFFIFLGVPGTERFVNLLVPFMFLAVIEGATGGFVGEKIYRKIEKRPLIRRIRG